MFSNRYSLEYCYTLEEMFGSTSGNVDSVPALSTYGTLVAGFNYDDYWKTGIGYKLWSKIYYKYRDHVCLITEKEWDINQKDLTRQFWKDFYTIFDGTHAYYEKLISLFESKENNLLNTVSSSVENEIKFNDTPQNAGDFDTDNHTTNVSKSKTTSQTDAGTVMERLDEIRRRYTDLYNDWADRFDRLFICSLNYDKEVNCYE